jgi:hypothetical protein
VAAYQIFVVVTKSTGTASTVSASSKLAARVVATWIRIQDGHLFLASNKFFFGVEFICGR